MASGGLLAATLVVGVDSSLVHVLGLDGGVLILPWTDLIRYSCPLVLLAAVVSLVASLFTGAGRALPQIRLAALAAVLVPVTFAFANLLTRANLTVHRLPPGPWWWTAGF